MLSLFKFYGLNQYSNIAGQTITHDAQGNLNPDGIWTYVHDTAPQGLYTFRVKTAAELGTLKGIYEY